MKALNSLRLQDDLNSNAFNKYQSERDQKVKIETPDALR